MLEHFVELVMYDSYQIYKIACSVHVLIFVSIIVMLCGCGRIWEHHGESGLGEAPSCCGE